MPGPFVVKISLDSNQNWQIEVSEDDKLPDPDGRSHHKFMLDIANAPAATADIQRDWQARRAGGAPNLPHYRLHPNHAPIAVQAGDEVMFKLASPAKACVIFITPDPKVTRVVGSPPDPFDWNEIKSIPSTGLTGTVRDRATQQRFYKCTALVTTAEGEVINVDPDMICGLP
jgi:hypothetical protein